MNFGLFLFVALALLSLIPLIALIVYAVAGLRLMRQGTIEGSNLKRRSGRIKLLKASIGVVLWLALTYLTMLLFLYWEL